MIWVLTALTVLVPVAEGHGSGASVVSAQGQFRLAPAGVQNDSLHAYLTDLGLPLHEGDRLGFRWQVEDGFGPSIYFEIHAHPGTGGFVLAYHNTSRWLNGSWKVPATEPYMVYWLNPNPVSLNVSYSFALFPPPPSLAFTILILALSSAPLTLGAVAVIWWLGRRRRRRRHAPPPSA